VLLNHVGKDDAIDAGHGDIRENQLNR